jgi:hypothetical protein
MSSDVKATVIWQGLPVDTYTNLETGEILVYQKGSILLPGSGPGGLLSSGLLAYSTPGNGQTKWQYNNQAFFRNLYNNVQRDNNKPVLTEKQFNQRFFTQGTTALNKIRATILTDEDSRNYANANISVIDTEQLKKNHFDNGVPGVINPVTRQQVNSDGTKTDSGVTDQQIVVVDDSANPDPDAPAAPVLPGPDAPDNIGTDVDGDGVISQGPNPSYESELKDRGGTSKTLKYPYHTPPAGFEYDYISITAYDYEPSGLGDNYDSDKNLGQQYETVFFPMQPQLSETNAVSWSDDQLNPIQAGFGDAAKKIIDKLGGADISGAFKEIGAGFDTLKTKLQTPELKSFISAYFAGQAVGANIVGRATGMVINPNLELLFNGPNLRTFQFNFRLTPRSQVESEEIRRIIRAFKRNMAVSRSTSNLFLLSPRIFKLKYIYKNGGEHPYLNKFKPCALSNFQVNYTPDGSYATFDSTGSLTAYDLTMSFSEVMPIYAEDIPGNTESTMGY